MERTNMKSRFKRMFSATFGTVSVELPAAFFRSCRLPVARVRDFHGSDAERGGLTA
jgi:hypothetical protein